MWTEVLVGYSLKLLDQFFVRVPRPDVLVDSQKDFELFQLVGAAHWVGVLSLEERELVPNLPSGDWVGFELTFSGTTLVWGSLHALANRGHRHFLGKCAFVFLAPYFLGLVQRKLGFLRSLIMSHFGGVFDSGGLWGSHYGLQFIQGFLVIFLEFHFLLIEKFFDT